MGFEVETDGIKVQHNDEDTILVILASEDGKWQLTTDTQDITSIARTGWVNLECRTVGGLTLPEIEKYIHVTQMVLKRLKQLSAASEDGRHALRNGDIRVDGVNLIWQLESDHIVIATKRPSPEPGGVFTEIPFVLRPQLTFLFPLKMTRHVFHNILKEHRFVSPRILNKENITKAGAIPAKQILLREAEQRQAAHVQEIETLSQRIQSRASGPEEAEVKTLGELHQQKLEAARVIARLKDTLDPLIPRAQFFSDRMIHYLFPESDVDPGGDFDGIRFNTDLDGLFLLLSAYVYDLFVENKQNPLLKEPGPKGFLKIVSRFSFSDMYKTLHPGEQEQFLGFAHLNFRDLLPQGIKPYRRDDPRLCLAEEATGPKGDFIADPERINLETWLRSIAAPRVRVLSRGPQDLLTPPLCTSQRYSMGAISNELYPRHALIEARGYANSCETVPGDPERTIDNMAKLIHNEASKFFSIGVFGK